MDRSIISYFERTSGYLAAMLRELKSKTVYYYPNPGNAGDSLIAAATYQLFQHYGIKPELIFSPDQAKPLSNEIVLLGGGGNLVPMYQGTATMLRALAERRNRVVLLPHSVRGHEALLASLEPSTVVFCREVESYRHTLESAEKSDVQIGHDLALFLDVVELMNAPGLKEEAEPEFRSRLSSQLRLSPEAVSGRRVSCFRHGVEKTFIPKGPNYDISVVFRTGVDPKQAELGSWMMLEFTRLAAQITTNRLHVGVASALTGIPTALHDNSYGKLSGVYNHSMRGRFGHVRFVRGDTALDAQGAEEPARSALAPVGS